MEEKKTRLKSILKSMLGVSKLNILTFLELYKFAERNLTFCTISNVLEKIIN